MTSPSRAVFLDRDGVLNAVRMVDGAAHSPRALDEFTVLDGVPEAIRELRSAGWLTVVVTNQPDVARGLLDAATLAAMHKRLNDEAGVDLIEACLHDGLQGCDCRKPLPGMLTRVAERRGLDLTDCWMVGDRWVDLAAGRAAGTRCLLVERPWTWLGTSAGSPKPDLEPDATVVDVAEAARLILTEGDEPAG